MCFGLIIQLVINAYGRIHRNRLEVKCCICSETNLTVSLKGATQRR